MPRPWLTRAYMRVVSCVLTAAVVLQANSGRPCLQRSRCQCTARYGRGPTGCDEEASASSSYGARLYPSVWRSRLPQDDLHGGRTSATSEAFLNPGSCSSHVQARTFPLMSWPDRYGRQSLSAGGMYVSGCCPDGTTLFLKCARCAAGSGGHGFWALEHVPRTHIRAPHKLPQYCYARRQHRGPTEGFTRLRATSTHTNRCWGVGAHNGTSFACSLSRESMA